MTYDITSSQSSTFSPFRKTSSPNETLDWPRISAAFRFGTYPHASRVARSYRLQA